MSDVASNDTLRREAPGLSEALLFAASGRLRNMASISGNLLQRNGASISVTTISPATSARPKADAA
jgi:CO/xanthine dehydrogenase FAD-binding subunit